MRNILTVVMVAMCLTLIACGFHLRGEYQLPDSLRVVHINASSSNYALSRLLRRELTSSGSVVVADATSATATITFSPEIKGRYVLSVDRSGQVREYRLDYTLVFTASAKDQSFRLENSEIKLSRVLVYNPVGVLGSSAESDRLYETMQRDAVRLIMRKLQAQRNAVAPEKSATP